MAAFPLCYYLLPNLRDRGASIAMPFGILTVGYASWILSVLRVVPSTQVTIVLLLILMAVVSAWVVKRNWREMVEFVVREWTTLALGQIIFLGVFAVWIVYRFHDPSINHTEQPMDFMFLNSSVRSVLGTPEDSWLRGAGISYYYFGYWNFALLTKLTGIVSSVTYNLSLALVPAMAAMGMYGLVSNLVRADRGKIKAAVLAGMGAALMLVFLANLEGALEFMRANGMGSDGFWSWIAVEGLTSPSGSLTNQWWPTENWWWWRATRVIGSFEAGLQTDYTIHEFPAFSYILGDLHPHVMSVPFVMMFLGFLWNFWRAPSVWSLHDWRPYLSLFVIAFLLGGLGFTNMWDLAVFGLVFLLVAALKTYRSGKTRIRDLMSGDGASCAARGGRGVRALLAVFPDLHESGGWYRSADRSSHSSRSSTSGVGTVSRCSCTLRHHRLLAYHGQGGLVAHDAIRTGGGSSAFRGLDDPERE